MTAYLSQLICFFKAENISVGKRFTVPTLKYSCKCSTIASQSFYDQPNGARAERLSRYSLFIIRAAATTNGPLASTIIAGDLNFSCPSPFAQLKRKIKRNTEGNKSGHITSLSMRPNKRIIKIEWREWVKKKKKKLMQFSCDNCWLWNEEISRAPPHTSVMYVSQLLVFWPGIWWRKASSLICKMLAITPLWNALSMHSKFLRGRDLWHCPRFMQL